MAMEFRPGNSIKQNNSGKNICFIKLVLPKKNIGEDIYCLVLSETDFNIGE